MTDVTIKVDQGYRDKLNAMSEKRALSMKIFLHGMIDYFEQTDLDPTTKELRLPDELARIRKDILSAIKEMRNTHIAFIREQEKTKLGPMIKQINDITESLIRFLNEEALHKSDLDQILKKLPASATEQLKIPFTGGAAEVHEKRTTNTNYENLLNLAREMFVDFLKNGKRSTFGSGVVFDQSIIENYKMEFAKLKF